MPSHFKYRIKKASEKTKSVWDYDSIPSHILDDMKQRRVFQETDRNIVPGTCAFIQKVVDSKGNVRYLCALKHYRSRPDLIPSDHSVAHPSQDGWGERRVSGALKISKSDSQEFFYKTHFLCQYIDERTGAGLKDQGTSSDQDTLLFPMCSCYTPRGGLAVTLFDGAVKGSEAVGFSAPPGTLPNAYDVWQGNDTGNPYDSAPLPAYFMPDAREKFPFRPPKIGFLHMMLNARATVCPCCWWVAPRVLIYKPEHFRVIDMAVAQEYVMPRGDKTSPDYSTEFGVSNIADYEARMGDYYYPNTGQNYFKNILLGRNYDPTLPDCGNNQRIIYTLDSAVVGELTRDRYDGDEECEDIPWHFDSSVWFSPRNCGHPDCKVRYQWGSMCNGGGAYDLATGRGCPYYENPLIGPEAESEKLCRLADMYPGDYITGGSVLELMWMSKGGLPWTQEEWESMWRVPYIWSTVPFNPEKEMTRTFRDSRGNVRKASGATVMQNKVYAVRTSVNLNTGKAEQSAPKLLPGGSITQFNRKPNSQLKPGDQAPDLPTLIQALEVTAIGRLDIIWPLTDFSILTMNVEKTEDYAEKIKEIRNKPYKQLIWGPEGKNIMVMGYGSTGQYSNGVYCLNLEMVTSDWRKDVTRLQFLLSEGRLYETETQTLLANLWRACIRSKLEGEDPVLDGMEVQRALLDARGLFVFKSIPLNLLFEENFVLVFGVNANSTFSASYTKVQPIFRRGYLYQSKTTLMTGWKTVWNGRPSVFFNEETLGEISGETYEKGKATKVDVAIQEAAPSPSLTGYESLTDLLEKAEALSNEIYLINDGFELATDATMRSHYQKQLDSKYQALEQIKAYIVSYTAQQTEAVSSAMEGDTAAERAEIEARISDIETQISELKDKKQEAADNSHSDLSSFYKGLIKELEYDIEILQNRLKLLPEEEEEEDSEPDDDDTEEEQTPWCVTIDYDSGDEDTDEGGVSDVEDEPPLASRLYIPHLSSNPDDKRDLAYYKSILPESIADEKEDIKLNVPNDAGITEWKYLEVEHDSTNESLIPKWVYPPKGAKRAVVYSTKDYTGAGASNDDSIAGVKLTEDLGRWFLMSSCSSLIVLIMNPEIANRHNEFMIFSLTAEVRYTIRNASGMEETSTRKIKFVPFNYSQVNRVFPGYSEGKTVEYIGDINKKGAQHKKYSVSENIEIMDKPEGNRHPWVFFAMACDEDSGVKSWPLYSGEWYPGGDLKFVTLPSKRENIDLYIEYAFIGEVYDQDDRKFKDWEDHTQPHKTRLSFNHPKAGNVKAVFTIGTGAIGELVGDGGIADGYANVPIGSCTMASMWPYARLACRDFEIHYIWRDDKKNIQVTESFSMGRREPRRAYGYSKRYTYYCAGDHDLGNVFQPKITWAHWEGVGDEARFSEDEISYSWKTGREQSAANPTDNFPETCGQSYTPGNHEGPLYYPYTRAEPHSKFVPVHPVYIWDFLVHYRNKPEAQKYFGAHRMRAADICHIGQAEQRTSKWEVSYEFNPKARTQFMGRSRTRGPIFQLEYEDYEEKKPKIIFLVPFASRATATRGSTWTYYMKARATADEDWDPDEYEAPPKSDTPEIADNPDNLTVGVWKAICRSLYEAWANGDDSAYYDLVAQKNWGASRSPKLEVEFEGGLRFPDEEAYETPDAPDPNAEQRESISARIEYYRNWVTYLETALTKEGIYTDKEKENFKADIERTKAIIDKLRNDLEALGGPLPGDEEEDEEDIPKPPQKPEEKEDLDVDLLTGCHKSVVEAIDQRGSFFFDNSYMPTSVTSEGWLSQMEQEAEEIKENLKKQSRRFYQYEQKSFGLNVPWSPYDSPPLFGNTGREMFIVELCTVGSIISWVPPTSTDTPTQGKENVPSWWASREPVGEPKELVTLLPPPLECSRALHTLSDEPQSPMYSYLFVSPPFDEIEPVFKDEYFPSEIRLLTKHEANHYGEPWYRSDVGRMTMTMTDSADLTNIIVYGDSPATKESWYTSVKTAAIYEGDPVAAQSPNEGDVKRDETTDRTSMWGKDIKGLAVEGGFTVSVGDYYPGYYSPYWHGRVFVGYRPLLARGFGYLYGEQSLHWAWPKRDRNKVTRGKRFIRWWVELPDLESEGKGEPAYWSTTDRTLGSISGLKSAPYVTKHPIVDDGREINIGPQLKIVSQGSDDRETSYAEVTYYAIVAESERDQGGKIRPPLIWAQQLDSPDQGSNIGNFKRPKGGAVAYKVLWDGSISAVNLGGEQSNIETAFSTGFLTDKQITNTSKGGNFITSDVLTAAGEYPAFEIDHVEYRYLAKSATTKDYVGEDLKARVRKSKHGRGYNVHTVETELIIPTLSADVLFLNIDYNSFFKDEIEETLFKNPGDGATLEVIVTGDPVIGASLETKYEKNYLRDMPLEAGSNVIDTRVYYDLDFGMSKNLTIKFKWYVVCDVHLFDKGPWKGDEKKYNYETKKWEEDPEEETFLKDLVDRITLGVMVPGKCVEVVAIEEAGFVVSFGSRPQKKIFSTQSDSMAQDILSQGVSYDFFTEADPEWFQCQWKESDKNIERDWDRESLYSTSKGEKVSDNWARSGYETQIDSLREAGLNYNKEPKATAFPNSCVELPELPQSVLKMEAWDKYVGPDDQERDWTWGGIWTTRVAGPEWRTSDPHLSRDFIWWPAPHYHTGTFIFKGRFWVFGPQYKDEALVMEDERDVYDDDPFNENAYKNELSSYDKLVRNLQEFELYREIVQKNTEAKSQQARTKAINRKRAATQRGLDSMYSSAGASTPAPDMTPNNRNYVVNTNKAYTYLDEVGLTPETADWDELEEVETEKQKELFNAAASLADPFFSANDKAIPAEEDDYADKRPTRIRATAIIPYYDWEALEELTDKEWSDRNAGVQTDYSPVTCESLNFLRDEWCYFIWKNWAWSEVTSFTFRSEYDSIYKPKASTTDLSKSGLLRKCGKKWTILGKPRKEPNTFDVIIDLINDELVDILQKEETEAESEQSVAKLEDAISMLKQMASAITTYRDYYKNLGKKMWKYYRTRMPAGFGTLPFVVIRDRVLLNDMEQAFAVDSPQFISDLQGYSDDVRDIDFYSAEFNKAVMEATEAINSTILKIEEIMPLLEDTHQKLNYFNNVTEELRISVRHAIAALGVVTGRTNERIGQVDCHGDQDDDPKGDCDPDGYPQKWSWVEGRNDSEPWPSTVSNNGGSSLNRPDPWWRY